jgi:5-methylthioribose kinase
MTDTLQIDIENAAELRAWLAQQGLVASGVEPRCSCLAGGVSNKTVLVELPERALVVKQALEQLRTAVEWRSRPERVHREGTALRKVSGRLQGLRVPSWIAEDHEQHILAMAAVPTPHENLKDRLLTGPVPERIGWRLGCGLASLHAASVADSARWRALFADRSFFESLRLEPYYGYAGQQIPAARPWLERLIADCRARQQTLVHGDFSPKNILLQSNDVWLLDYEVVHWGDAAFDLGFCLAHFLSKARHLPSLRLALLAEALALFAAVQTDSPAVNSDAQWETYAVRHTLGCLLARVAGRSTLEYLDADERPRQRNTVIGMLANEPATLPALVDAWLQTLG